MRIVNWNYFVFYAASVFIAVSEAKLKIPADQLLSRADEVLGKGDYDRAIQIYQSGIEALTEDESLLTILSLQTNMATALSAMGNDEQAAKHYHACISSYKEEIEEIVDEEMKKDATDIAAQASFYLGMVYQDLREAEKAVGAYAFAVQLDPLHWSSMANLASVLQDELEHYDRALEYYNRAYNTLTSEDINPTDPPAEPRFILGQLQYRIGLCLNHFDSLNKKCTRADDPNHAPISCKEMATHAFSLAVQYDSDNDLAQHMLATITADATMTRASNKYVKSLFDDYAHNFEDSLVKDLNYTGYERLRRGFDRAFQGNPPMFDTVIDAGCGTGLVGEQFRNVSSVLIGVDLSQAILDEAERMRPNLYDERIEGDVTQVFAAKAPLSLIVAADSYIYFGDLVPLFESMGKSVEVGGYLAFTLENVGLENEASLATSKPDWRWQLTPSGRFAHRKEYVESVGESVGFEVIRYEPLDGFRHEQGVDVRGHMFIMKKVGGNEEL